MIARVWPLLTEMIVCSGENAAAVVGEVCMTLAAMGTSKVVGVWYGTVGLLLAKLQLLQVNELAVVGAK